MAPLLQLKDLAIAYASRAGEFRAVRGVSLTIERGQAYGLVGESGCGKTSLAFAVMAYLGRNGRIAAGQVALRRRGSLRRCPPRLFGRCAAGGSRWSTRTRWPHSTRPDRAASSSPRCSRSTRGSAVAPRGPPVDAMLERVHMPDPPAIMRRYPHQLSGGQQQRVVIAMALLRTLDLLIMDEPTTGLDVTVEATVLDLVAALRRELDTAILYISHNLGVIARICDRVGVMYAGELMEEADVTTLFMAPRHPYTRSLLRCVPRADAGRAAQQLCRHSRAGPSRRRAPAWLRLRAEVRLRRPRVSRRPPRQPTPWPRGTSCAASAGGTSASSTGDREPSRDRRCRGNARPPPEPRPAPRLLLPGHEAPGAAPRPAPTRAGRGRRHRGRARRPDTERGRRKRLREEHARALRRRAGRGRTSGRVTFRGPTSAVWWSGATPPCSARSRSSSRIRTRP